MFSQFLIFILMTDEKFDGLNWIDWKRMITSAADACSLDGYLDGTITKPTDPSPDQAAPTPTSYWCSKTPTPEQWQQCNAYAKGMVTLNVKNQIRHSVKTDGTAVEAWKSLTNIQDAISDIGRINANIKLCSI